MTRRLAAILAADVAGYSALMSEDEAGTLAALQAHRAEAINPAVARRGGRIVKLMGDGILVEFASAVEAVACAAEVQKAMAGRNAEAPSGRGMAFRIGVHIGDVIAEGDDIYGDGVNIAARLEGIAAPGGICLSRQAHEQVDGKLPLTYRELGPQTLKNIPKPVEVFAVEIDGAANSSTTQPTAKPVQEIKYCRAPDGVRLAYAKIGRGPPLIKAAHWMNHLEIDWQDGSVTLPFYLGLARQHSFVRYDARGNGLSDWDVDEVSLDAWVSDLATVAEATEVSRFALLGVSQGAAISIAYAVQHPERVSHLILFGGFPRGRYARAKDDAERQMIKAMETLIRSGWGANNPAFRQLFTSQFMPDATKEQADWFNEMQLKSASPEGAVRYFSTVGDLDVTALLPQIRVPTLVMHARGDGVHPVELAREMAGAIPGAKFVALASRNHVPLWQDPTTERAIEEINLFLAK